MADTKISSLTELSTSPESNDLIVIVDVSDTTQAPTGTTKKVQYGTLPVPAFGLTTINDISYTLALSDNFKTVVMTTTSGSASIVCPSDADAAFPLGSYIYIYCTGVGVSGSVTPGTDATVNVFGSGLNIGGQYALINLRKVAADTWHASGDLTIP